MTRKICYRLEILFLAIIPEIFREDMAYVLGTISFFSVDDFLPMHRFRQCVNRYNGNRHVKSFSCLDQFLFMAFAQLSYRESLRDIESCMRAMQKKLYHLGIRSQISKSTLADANENRDWRIYADFAQVLISIARKLYATVPVDELLLDINGSLELTAWVLTPSIGYNLLQTERVRFDVLAGARYLYLKSDVKLGLVSFPSIRTRDTVSDSIWDGIVGVKGHINLSKNWYLPYYADIGTGNSNTTWQVFGGVGYRFKRLDLVAAYRYMDYNFDDSDVFEDLNLHGPFLGVKFRF